MISNEPSRMYAALRCIEDELAKEKPSIVSIRAIVLEASRELRPTLRAVDGLWACPKCNHVNDGEYVKCESCGHRRN